MSCGRLATDVSLPAGPAQDAAVATAQASGVEIHELVEVRDLKAVYSHIDSIWGPNLAQAPVSTEVLRALAKSGNYIVAAFAGDELVGTCVGFFAPPRSQTLHSHIAAVSPGGRGRSVGFALKMHQRAWALARGVSTITWTFDPLVARNAYFNVAKLRATPVEYLPDFYGEMEDQINRNDATDRLLMRWELESPQVNSACGGVRARVDASQLRAAGGSVALDRAADGSPDRGPSSGQTVLVAVPEDVERLRATSPQLASDWRVALREVLLPMMSAGARITGFDRSGWYVVSKELP
jgi:predicted GNAT superfamily acetyltransferase